MIELGAARAPLFSRGSIWALPGPLGCAWGDLTRSHIRGPRELRVVMWIVRGLRLAKPENLSRGRNEA